MFASFSLNQIKCPAWCILSPRPCSYFPRCLNMTSNWMRVLGKARLPGRLSSAWHLGLWAMLRVWDPLAPMPFLVAAVGWSSASGSYENPNPMGISVPGVQGGRAEVWETGGRFHYCHQKSQGSLHPSPWLLKRLLPNHPRKRYHLWGHLPLILKSRVWVSLPWMPTNLMSYDCYNKWQ